MKKIQLENVLLLFNTQTTRNRTRHKQVEYFLHPRTNKSFEKIIKYYSNDFEIINKTKKKISFFLRYIFVVVVVVVGFVE